MRYLQLWRWLRAGSFPAAEVAAALEELSGWPLADRWPLFGWLTPAIEHSQPEVRRAAIAVLSDASGLYAYRHLVAALDDTDRTVRLAAVESLRVSAALDPPRWTHALCHPNAEIREAAVRGPCVKGMETLHAQAALGIDLPVGEGQDSSHAPDPSSFTDSPMEDAGGARPGNSTESSLDAGEPSAATRRWWRRLTAARSKRSTRAASAKAPLDKVLLLHLDDRRLTADASEDGVIFVSKTLQRLREAMRRENRVQALRDFLDESTTSISEAHKKAATWLLNRGDFYGFPIVLGEEAERWRKERQLFLHHGIERSQEDREQQEDKNQADVGNLFREANPELLLGTVEAALIAGPKIVIEHSLLEAVLKADVFSGQMEALEMLVSDLCSDEVRQQAADHLQPSAARTWKLRCLAEDLTWGKRTGHLLTGRQFTIRMLAGEELGHTDLTQNTIAVNPLPVLRQEEDGRDILRGLILHELGHQKYHSSVQGKKVAQRAQKEKLFPLLNLVADEHLERKLRAEDRDYGDKLKRLAAYAFQHCQKEISVARLLSACGEHTAEVLTNAHVRLARRPGCVKLNSGCLLMAVSHQSSFVRFMRALRMGLGNRARDPKVAEALQLFGQDFHNASMSTLLNVARDLRRIFGEETDLLDLFSQDHWVSVDEGDVIIHGDGIRDEDIEEASEGVVRQPGRSPGLRDRRLTARGNRGRRGSRPQFDQAKQHMPEMTVVPLQFDRLAYASYARQVQRPARRLRSHLQHLGLALRPMRRRLTGRTVEQGRLRDLILRNDPRIHILRRRVMAADLFLGVVIECSDEMEGRDLERAKEFGAMLAESAKALSGVDVRLFGFNHRILYDAGDENRPAVAGLNASGGKNEAGALWLAAEEALGSPRRTRVLVLVSGAVPSQCAMCENTECRLRKLGSPESLRKLVAELTRRRGICCVQVALQPLSEACFPNPVSLNDDDFDQSIQRFGRSIAQIVRKAMRG